jgi:asparagine synthase (glutamine-hydrolysing)
MISGWVDFATATAEREALGIESSGVVVGPGVRVSVDGDAASIASDTSCVVALQGSPRFASARLMQLAERENAAAAWLAHYRERGLEAPRDVKGDFAVAIIDLDSRRLVLATDRFGVRPICYAVEAHRVAFADRADAVPLAGPCGIEPQALFDYLYFHVIPAPRTVFKGVGRVPAGHEVICSRAKCEIRPWWTPRFDEHSRRPLEILKAEFLDTVRSAVAREAAGGGIGAFLSGGTDSSTVSGMIGHVSGQPARTYSIGFDALGYDEMEYARIAARHFRTDHHEYYLTPEDLIAAIPSVAAHYDQPFGNSSALPAYFCAQLARQDGVRRMLAGDGGDELFGGNTRYAIQRVFEVYEAIPAPLRRGFVEPVLLGLPALARIPLGRKAASYIKQARVPMPDRMNAYNLLTRLGLQTMLAPAFLASVDASDPQRQQREVWQRCDAGSLVNRMLAYDWKYTLADNDLPKVVGTANLAGISVGFPLLSDEVVDFSLGLRPALKLKGFKLRWFFKEALKGFLPDEIITKKKHGFGLPFGVWLTRHAGLREFALDALAALRPRGLVRPEFLDELMSRRLAEHPSYYGEMVWILMMLEQWLGPRKLAALEGT